MKITKGDGYTTYTLEFEGGKIEMVYVYDLSFNGYAYCNWFIDLYYEIRGIQI